MKIILFCTFNEFSYLIFSLCKHIIKNYIFENADPVLYYRPPSSMDGKAYVIWICQQCCRWWRNINLNVYLLFGSSAAWNRAFHATK